YLGYTVEVQRYLPLYRGDRILLLRALLAKQSTINDNAIPFYELNSLDLDHGLRGFSRGRWRDRGRLLFNVEWRYPVWERMQGSLFYDVGQVFRDFRDLESRTFRYSAGMGFRFTTRQQFTFRAHLAISEDGVLAVLKGDLEFLRRRGSVLGGF
ncbi:MAG: BamA/TamA family outer membrane protein, partial [Nitrospirales bacterium]